MISEDTLFTVQSLNQSARLLLESHFGLVWVKGELSGVKAHHSGHLYFTLKDAYAQIRCVLFRAKQRQLGFQPQDGMAVLVQAAVTLYEQGGSYQLTVAHLEEAGLGSLQQAFEQLKNKLQAEGLFSEAHKKPLPRFPQHIGIITSRTGAALQDILSVLKRRYPIASLTLYHAQVQGKAAASDIVNAIQSANRHKKADLLILARGGGSLEDLFCFNEEKVARALFESMLPIVTGIGHEIDFTIADFVADLRAPTPSAAAESAVPDSKELLQTFQHWLLRLTQSIERKLRHYALTLDNLEKRLIHPRQRIQQVVSLLTQLQYRLRQTIHTYLLTRNNTFGYIITSLKRHTPLLQIQRYQTHCAQKHQQCQWAFQRCLERAHHRLQQNTARLQHLSPLATLNRGYAVITNAAHALIHSSQTLAPGETVYAQLAKGRFTAKILEIEPAPSVTTNT